MCVDVAGDHPLRWGIERNRNGGHAAMAILALPAVAGKFGVKGGGYSMSTSPPGRSGNSRWIDAPEPTHRIVNMNQLGQGADGICTIRRLQMLFVYNANPVATIPDLN